jgi:hypothetical protein
MTIKKPEKLLINAQAPLGGLLVFFALFATLRAVKTVGSDVSVKIGKSDLRKLRTGEEKGRIMSAI